MTAEAYRTGFRSPKVDIHDFSMIPRADIPRSQFHMQHQHKTTIQAGALYPVYLQEVLPGDTFNIKMTAFIRLSTPLFPLLDNMDVESFFFFVPNRLVWVHWKQFMGEQNNPSDTISYSVPVITPPAAGFAAHSIYDYLGIPLGFANQPTGISALPLRAYNLIYNEWFRDENLQVSQGFGSTNGTGFGGSAVMDDGPDPYNNYGIVQIGKRHDYFTSCLPWTQKGAAGAVTIPLAGSATVKTNSTNLITSGSWTPLQFKDAGSLSSPASNVLFGGGATTGGTSGFTYGGNAMTAPVSSGLVPVNLYADLTTATSTTINALRLAFQTQKLLERDARGGTRYTEIVRSHFGVISPDARLQRPEYLGGGKAPVSLSAVPQTTQTGLTGGTTPLGTLGAIGTSVFNHAASGSFTEHGHIIGIIAVRADEIYQQGIRKLWSRSTRYDFYFPAFAMLGEQAVLNKEIYSDGSANDALVFGYQERWAEYRYHPSYTSSYFRSTNATPLDAWHLAVKFGALPTLNAAFIVSPLSTILGRNLAIGSSTPNQQLLCDLFFDEKVARPMPMYSVPGLIDHF